MKNINPNLFKFSLIIILSIVNVTYFSGIVSAIELYGQKVEEKIKKIENGFSEKNKKKYCKITLTTEKNKKIVIENSEEHFSLAGKNGCSEVVNDIEAQLVKAKLYTKKTSNSDESNNSDNSNNKTGKSCGGTSTALIECDGNENGLVALIKMIVNVLYAMVGVVAVIMIMAAGVVYATAGENANQINTAKTMIRNTVIGILLYVFMTIILNFLVPGGVFK